MRLLLIFLLHTISVACFGQLCEIEIVQETEHPCRGDLVTLSVEPGQAELEVPLDTLNGLRGIMFDVQVNKSIEINGVSARPRDTTTMELWYKVGTHDGFQTAPGVWTFVQSWSNVPASSLPEKLELDVPVSIPAGQIFGFYLTSTHPTISIDYSNGIATAAVSSFDSNIEILEGSGVEYPFGGSSALVFEPRRLYGSVFYSAVPELTWSTGAMTTSINTIADSPEWISAVADFYELGCSATDSLRVFGYPEEVLPPAAVLCTDQTITLSAGLGIGTGYTYLWTTGETGTFLELNGSDYAPGEYIFTVDINDGIGCTATDVIRVTVEDPPSASLPASVWICEGQGLLLDPETGTDYNYLWSDGSTDTALVIAEGSLASGVHVFTVNINKGPGCELIETVEVEVLVCTGIDDFLKTPKIFPNPVEEFLYIEGPSVGTRYRIADLAGKNIISSKISGQGIHTSGLSEGMYILKVEGYANTKFIRR